MDYIRNNKMLVGVLCLVLLVVLIVYITLNTSLFNENKRIANEVNKAEKGEVKRVDYKSSMSKNLDEYAQTDDNKDYDKLDKEEQVIADSWVDLTREDGDSALMRDMKVEAKDGVYKSVTQYAKESGKSVEKLYDDHGNLYGDLGVGNFQGEDGLATGLYYSNEFKNLGNMRIEGISFNEDFSSIKLTVRNEGKKIEYRPVLKKDIKVSVNGISNSEFRKTLKDEKDYALTDVIGVGLVKDINLDFTKNFLEGMNVTDREDIDALPDKVKVSLEYGRDKVEYILERNDKGNYSKFNSNLELELRN